MARVPLFILLLAAVSYDVVRAADIDFERDVAPSLANYCLDCHRPGKTSGGLNLATADGLLKGGESGAVLKPGKAAESLLIERLAAGEMPPEDEAGKPPRRRPNPREIERLKAWIAAGAEWPAGRELGLHEQTVDLEKAKTFWSFQPVRRPALPVVKHPSRVANPIDAFIWQKLEASRIELSPSADKRSLLRRAYLDLHGLPPGIKAQDAFLANDSPRSYEDVIDELLSSPAYGERWARHWLDVVRYADSNGYERDGDKPHVWKYRDYVIDALNADKPYDRFVREQIAGDELPDGGPETLIATGFHALGTWNDEVDPLEAAQYRADELDDLVRTTSQTFLGITLGCARCHNHKFDPLTMVDYYSLVAVLTPMKRPNFGRVDGDRPIGTPAEIAALTERDKKLFPLMVEINKLKPMGKSAEGKVKELEAEVQRLKAGTPDLPRAYVLFEESPQAPATYLLLSGRASSPGPLMQPRVPAVLTKEQPKFAAGQFTTQRRTALANWIVNDRNPLTARVIVNRVWQHHFGRGLVATPSDFGEKGARPTHPELLDYLADWFMHDAGWSLKKLHRLIMTSETYQASSAASRAALEKDPENLLLSHYPLTRLDVEAIRDSMLAASGDLNRRMHGPAVYLPIAKEVVEAHTDKEAAWKSSPPGETRRRTVYAYVKRTLLVPMLEVLDLCDVSSSSERRITTSIAPQALSLYNGEFVNQQAAALAERVMRETSDRDGQIDRAYRHALCRPPTAEELTALRKFLETERAGLLRDNPSLANAEAERRSLIQMCRVILNLNEFVYPK